MAADTAGLLEEVDCRQSSEEPSRPAVPVYDAAMLLMAALQAAPHGPCPCGPCPSGSCHSDPCPANTFVSCADVGGSDTAAMDSEGAPCEHSK